jgi:hypothetical protein
LSAGRPHEIEAWFLINDPLHHVLKPHPQEIPVALLGLPASPRGAGDVYRLPILGNHLLQSGETGSGKSEGGWAITRPTHRGR